MQIARKFMPHMLTDEQKQNHASICQDLQEKLQKGSQFPSVTLSFF
jgi:hypothetical protein